ncbi:MAG: DUF2029 domain-containing protein [Chloroflexaceae bacterium]|nr:DUF2029 domain-containing protein [Chloroflexaceae bacterium]
MMQKILFGLLWVLPALIAWIGWHAETSTTIDIGSSGDSALLTNFHEPESGLTDTYQWYTYRWSRPGAQVTLPAHALPAVLTLRGTVPADGTQVSLDLGTAVSVDLPQQTSLAVRRYHVLWPADSDMLGWAHITIDAQQPAQRAENRSLALLLANITLTSVDGPLRLPPLLAWLLLILLAPLLLWLSQQARLPRTLSLVLALLAGCSVTWLWAWQPWWVQPFLPNMGLALLALLALLGWMRLVWARVYWQPLPRLLLLLVVASGLIPLYLLLKYDLALWLNPVNLPIGAMLLGLLLPFAPAKAQPLLAAGIALVLLLYGLDRYQGAILKGYSTDFTALFRGVHAFLHGGQLYNFEHIRSNSLGDTYKYPPFFVLVLGPFSFLTYDPALQAWHLFNLALLLLAAWLLWRSGGQPLRSWSTLGLLYLLFSFKPLVDTLGQGQADILLLVSLAAALLALQQGRWSWWGACLALPSVIKLYPAYLLLHGLVWQRWQAVLAFAASIIVLTLLSIGLLGWPVHATFAFEVLPLIGGGTAWAENQTFNGWFNRLFTDEIALRPDEPGPARYLTYLAALVVTGLTWWRVRAMPLLDGMGLWIVAMLLVLPIAWMHYQALLVIPFYQLFLRLERDQQPWRWSTVLLYTLAWLLLCYGNQWTFFDRTYAGPLWAALLSYKFYGLLLLYAAIATERWDHKQWIMDNG